MGKLSCIVPLFNHVEESRQMLASLLQSMPPGLDYEIILVDDCSTDATRSWLASLNDLRIRVLLNEQNVGFARANHAGIRLASGDTLALLNNDLVFAPGWLEPMLEILAAPHLNAGIVGNQQVRVIDGELDHAGVELNFLGQFDHVRSVEAGLLQYGKLSVVTGACLLIRKADFAEVGGFDERFINGCEDIDLCLKVRASGKNVYVCHTSKIQHHVSLSRSRTNLQNERNSRLLYEKWRDTIKAELTMKWARALAAGEAAYADHIHGSLLPEFLSRPQIAARLIAESKLQGLAHYWQRALDGVEPNQGVGARVRAKGLRYIAPLSAYVLTGPAEFEIDGLSSARNFYVCGRIVQDFEPTQLAITLTVNGIQTQTFPLGQEGWNVNVGIIDPILLQGLPNRFELSVNLLDPAGQPGTPAPQALLLTHIVVDDQVVRRI